MSYTTVSVSLDDREDGGLNVYSDSLPGLILSGPDKERVASMIAPAIKTLFENRGLSVVRVEPERPVESVLAGASPRVIGVQVHGSKKAADTSTHESRYVVQFSGDGDDPRREAA
ncbi:MAG: hypothetical protein IT534_11800 [Bauldia sp.]|nr:hypothetical protein [Bauldia sp.]